MIEATETALAKKLSQQIANETMLGLAMLKEARNMRGASRQSRVPMSQAERGEKALAKRDRILKATLEYLHANSFAATQDLARACEVPMSTYSNNVSWLIQGGHMAVHSRGVYVLPVVS
tara:strand:+ start:20 stop:376 length:357 start_codon:yes stop_codon:yes gene_type:complete